MVTELLPLKIQYKDFSEWQNNLFKTKYIRMQEEYWLNRFSGEITLLNMPLDFIRPSVKSFEGNNIVLQLDENITKSTKKYLQRTRTTLFMILLTAV